MQKRSFLLLLGATVLLVGAAVLTAIRGDRALTSPPKEQRLFPGLAAHLGDLAWVRLTHGATKIDFADVAGRWAVVENGNYPAAQARMRRLLLGLAELTLVEPKTRRPDLFARLDLDDPSHGKSTLVTAQDRTGRTVAEVIVGKSRVDELGGGNDGVYIRKPGDTQTWLARGSLDLSADVKDWLDRRLVDIPPGRIASVTFTAPDGAVVTLRREAGGKFAVADPPADAKFKTEAALAEPAGALDGLELDDVKPAPDLPVPPGGVSTAVFATDDGLTVTARIFERDKADWLKIKAAGSGGAAKEATTINARLARWGYKIPADRAKLLRTRLADLVMPAKGS